MNKPIPNSIVAMAEEMAAWRRDIHAHPELGYEEERTAGVVAARLREFGFDVVETGVGKTGVVGVLHGAGGPAASAEERADRRYNQLKAKGIDVNLAALLRDIEQRDRRDQSRKAAPLKPADDAVVIDSTSMSVDAVVATVLALKNARLGLGALATSD